MNIFKWFKKFQWTYVQEYSTNLYLGEKEEYFWNHYRFKGNRYQEFRNDLNGDYNWIDLTEEEINALKPKIKIDNQGIHYIRD
jgi:hypothetical protein